MQNINPISRNKDLINPNHVFNKIDYILKLCEELVSYKGRTSGISLATRILDEYQKLNEAEKLSYFLDVNKRFTSNISDIRRDAELFLENSNLKNLNNLSVSIEGKRQELFRRMNMAIGGSEVLVFMRGDLLPLINDFPELKELDNDLIHLFRSWFNPGFLKLRKINWSTEASILEKFIANEKVHYIKDLSEIKKRLQNHKEFYAYFHPAIKIEPIIFVEVAYTKGIGKSIQEIINRNTKSNLSEFDSCMFYSINNCLVGLSRISLGNFLIKRVVQKILVDKPNIKKFYTLSPVPGFVKWLLENKGKNIVGYISETEIKSIFIIFDNTFDLSKLNAKTKNVILKLCAIYLIKVKIKDRPINKVASFHLGNGAFINDIFWNGDTSDNGMKSSLGIMVNYEYDLKRMDEYHESFFSKGKITLSKKVQKMIE
ncbi:malonyl-CoA decarboxylase domain-containing protein [Mariniflexile jejuense]|uniref:Malonyl-CoA decarboxylase domain-containing protein n=1 Tax=Mariniflexile jejuense TaxID=1173582 RepID=A0ABW3JLM3_9FLAO